VQHRPSCDGEKPKEREGKGFWLLSLFEGFNLIKNI